MPTNAGTNASISTPDQGVSCSGIRALADLPEILKIKK